MTVFSKNNCMQCKMVKRFLDEHGFKYTEINIDDQPEQKEVLQGIGFRTVPVVQKPDGTYFTGFNMPELRSL